MLAAGRMLAVAAAVASACSPADPDPRIATPAATVETVLRATHLWGAAAPAASFRSRDRDRRRPPSDVATLAICFFDFDRDDLASRGMADFVAGMLAAGQHGLSFDIHDRRATVRSGIRPIHLRRSRDGWQIVLAESVPPDIRRGLRAGGALSQQRRTSEIDL